MNWATRHQWSYDSIDENYNQPLSVTRLDWLVVISKNSILDHWGAIHLKFIYKQSDDATMLLLDKYLFNLKTLDEVIVHQNRGF
jgi:hypothetical protein